MPISCDLDSATMNPDDAKHLQELIAGSGIMHASSASVAAARDVRYYLLDIESDGESKSIKFDELSVPTQVRPLIDYLVSRSSNMLED